jgi:hypothetical protein
MVTVVPTTINSHGYLQSRDSLSNSLLANNVSCEWLLFPGGLMSNRGLALLW